MPIDRGAIDAQLREIGEGERWWEQREFRDLRYILHEGEHLRGVVVGKLLGPRRPRLRPAGWWLVAATDQRLICLKQERFARKQVEIANGEITAIHQGSRLRAYQITIHTQQRTYRLRIRKADAFRFARSLAPLVAEQMQREQGAAELGGRAPQALPGGSKHSRSQGGFASREQVQALETTIDRLADDVERLQQQVAFLENLLHKQSEEAFGQRMSAHP